MQRLYNLTAYLSNCVAGEVSFTLEPSVPDSRRVNSPFRIESCLRGLAICLEARTGASHLGFWRRGCLAL